MKINMIFRPPSPTERGLLMLSPRLMLPTLVTVIPMPTLVCLLAPALDWTPSPRAWTLPPRDMFLTTDTDITPTATTTARGLNNISNYLNLLSLLNINSSRSAEADAEADPALFYGAYGYPYGEFTSIFVW